MRLNFLRLGLFMLTMCFSFSLIAQLNVTGTVKDESGNALIGVTIAVQNSAVGSQTDIDGEYTIVVPGDGGTLVFSYVGYATQEVEVTSANTTVDVVMKEGVSQLDEIVVTGLASSVKRSNLANAVSSISTKELTGLTVNNTMDGALYGKFTGAEIRSNSGAPGGGMSIRLRGVTSIFGDQQPLFILDGVYLNNSTISLGTNIVSAAAGGGNTATNQDDASNRLADIEPEDIASIEVLKGASAAAIYGARAAGGVVIITTKRGQAGENKVAFSQTIGGKTPIRLLGQRNLDRQGILDNFGQSAAEAFDQNGWTDYEAELYDRIGMQSTSNLTVSGGDDRNAYFIGGTYRTEEGIVENTGYDKLTLRVNTDHKLADWIDIKTSAAYTNSSADRGFFNNGNTNTTVGYALAFTAPWESLFPDANGVYPAGSAGSNVLETMNTITNNESVNRLITSISADVKLISTDNQNLKLNLFGGVDQYSLRTTGLFPRSLSFYRPEGTLNGVSISGSTISKNRNMQASLVYSYYMDNGLNLRTQLGVTQFEEGINTVVTTAWGLNGSQSSLDQAANLAVNQNRRSAIDKGMFLQEEINYRDQIIATVGVRADKSSNNGDANKVYYYPKANLAVNLHEFDFWTSSLITQLKPRIAYGQSGRFANFNDRFNTLGGAFINGQSGLVTGNLRGNSNVEPERQSEFEAGVDVGFMGGRINLVATYYSKLVDDLLLRQSVPTSSGFTTLVNNAGALANQGIELELNADVLQNDNMRWNTSLRFWRNRSQITRLDIPAFNLGGFAASLGQYRIEEGKSATQLVGTYNSADAANLTLSDDGTMAVYGDAEADFNLSFNNFFTFGDFELSFVLHWKQGGDGVNLSTLLWDLGGLTWDYDDTTLDPTGALGNGDYRIQQWNSFGNASPWIEDASYLRLRELGLFYNIDRSLVGDVANIRVGFSGRNLINVFRYNSYDPEVSNFGNNVLANSIEVTPYPSARSFNFHLRFAF